jgi:hypothetical protein
MAMPVDLRSYPNVTIDPVDYGRFEHAIAQAISDSLKLLGPKAIVDDSEIRRLRAKVLAGLDLFLLHQHLPRNRLHTPAP